MLKSLKNNYHIRDYRIEDYFKIIPLWESLDLERPERGDNQEIIENTIKGGGKLIILEDIKTGEIIGTSWITNDQRRLYLHHFGIKTALQGKGLSKPLLEESLKFAKACGLQIKIEVHKTNTVALELYKKYSFKYLGDYEVYIIREFQ